LGVAPLLEDVDLYEKNRKFPLVYDSSTDPEVVREMELMEKENVNASGMETDGSDAESDADNDGSSIRLGIRRRCTSIPSQSMVSFKLIVFQVHAVAVHILRSEIRRKKARALICRKVKRQYRHLVFIRSMKVRWNTMHAELERAKLLQPAFNAFVTEMPDSLRGKARTTAKRKKNV
ncbi:hypothetical protein R3P38DRAFT_2417271, partial [Favolaschia claudopus]